MPDQRHFPSLYSYSLIITDGGSGRNSVVSFSSTDTLRYPEPGSTDTLRYPDPGSNDTLRYPDPGLNDTQRYREPSRSPFSPYR